MSCKSKTKHILQISLDFGLRLLLDEFLLFVVFSSSMLNARRKMHHIQLFESVW